MDTLTEEEQKSNRKLLSSAKTNKSLDYGVALPGPDAFEGLGGGVGLLGTKAKSATTSKTEDTPKTALYKDLQDIRAKRYELLSVARDVFNAEGHRLNLDYASNFHRTSKCKYYATGTAVGVLKSQLYKSAFYSGLQSCGSVWTCPVCTAKIQEKRRIEVAKAVEYFYNENYQAVLLTFTFSHKRTDILEILLDHFLISLRKMRSGNQWTLFKNRINFQGLIRALEITHSNNNGFHPHTHELWFLDEDVDQKEFTKFVKKQWLAACKKSGLFREGDNLKNFNERSLDIKFNCKASDYLNKQDSSQHWGVDREIAKGAAKKGKHPFYFLEENSLRSRALFLEFSNAIKGKSQLFWSRGLKDRIGVNEKTDEELAEEETDKADILGIFTLNDWKLIRRNNKRAEVLDLAENQDFQAITAYIDVLRSQGIAEGVAGCS